EEARFEMRPCSFPVVLSMSIWERCEWAITVCSNQSAEPGTLTSSIRVVNLRQPRRTLGRTASSSNLDGDLDWPRTPRSGPAPPGFRDLLPRALAPCHVVRPSHRTACGAHGRGV